MPPSPWMSDTQISEIQKQRGPFIIRNIKHNKLMIEINFITSKIKQNQQQNYTKIYLEIIHNKVNFNNNSAKLTEKRNLIQYYSRTSNVKRFYSKSTNVEKAIKLKEENQYSLLNISQRFMSKEIQVQIRLEAVHVILPILIGFAYQGEQLNTQNNNLALYLRLACTYNQSQNIVAQTL